MAPMVRGAVWREKDGAPFLMVTGTALALTIMGASAVGAAIVALLVVVLGASPADLGPHRVGLLVFSACYVAVSLLAGLVLSLTLQRGALRWLLDGPAYDSDEAQRVLQLPLQTTAVSGGLWLLGDVLISLANAFASTPRETLRVSIAILLGGIATAGITYLLTERFARPITARVLAVRPPERVVGLGVLPRLVMAWVLASGTPFAGILVVELLRTPGQRDTGGAATLLACVGILVGVLTTSLTARAIAEPLQGVRRALEAVEKGDYDVTVEMTDASELGRLEVGVNRMVAGLREREQLRDLFGRHVGVEVARHALEVGASLQGEVREVVCLFVDVVDSTGLAQRMEPHELVARLNRFFAAVVDAVSKEGGLVNKFEGDAALCIFGAPAPMDDPAGAALRAGRAIRDRVVRSGELDCGIGISGGKVFAGQLGTLSRLEYTVIGDPVNEAARLATIGKDLPGRLLAATHVVETADADEQRCWERHADVQLRGRQEPTCTSVPVD